MNCLLTLIAICLANFLLFSQTTYTSTGNGNWLSAATWDNGVPTNGVSAQVRNVIIIEAGHTVTVAGDGSGCNAGAEPEIDLQNVEVILRGTLAMNRVSRYCVLFISDYANINFDMQSGISIENGGKVDNSGIWDNGMTQGGNTLWSGFWDGDVSGPALVGLPLPIQLLNWEVVSSENEFTALWSTATEKNNHFFTIEESIDGEDFYSIKNIYTDSPNSLEVKKYTYNFNARASQSTLYYRLKQTDYDGEYSYSDIIAVRSNNRDVSLTVYPNPVENHQFTIEYFQTEVRDITITSLRFVPIDYLRENNTDKKTITIQLPETIKPGIYVISITTDETVIKKELLVK